jgi:hypothetical protein
MTVNKLKSEDRCAHLLADGRRCALPRAKAHDSFCVHHWRVSENSSDRASRTPEAAAYVAEALGSISQFKTATAVNDALAKLFTLRARKLISERDTVLFAYIIQLLLQTLQGVRQEFTSTHDFSGWNQIIEQAIQDAIGPRPQPPPSASRATSRHAKPKRRHEKPRPRREVVGLDSEEFAGEEQPEVGMPEQPEVAERG